MVNYFSQKNSIINIWEGFNYNPEFCGTLDFNIAQNNITSDPSAKEQILY